MAEAKSKSDKDGGRADRRGGMSISVDDVRSRIGQALWLVTVVFAVLLATGALTYALDANEGNSLVEFVREAADRVDLGIFSLENGIKEFAGKNAETKNALFNWGLGAVFWLVVGRVLDRVIRP